MAQDVTIQARYSGTCPECGGRWQPGDLIRSERTAPGNLNIAIWQHAVCPDSEDPTALRKGESVCTECWLVHPKGACGQ